MDSVEEYVRPPEKNPLTPRETAMRMLEHMHEDVSYEDIVRQLRILQDIEDTLNDVELAGFPADDAVREARAELDAPDDETLPDSDSDLTGRTRLVLRSQPDRGWRRLEDHPGSRSVLRDAVWHD